MRDSAGALGDRAAQHAVGALRHGREMRFAVKRRENGAAHQGRAAQAGQDRSGKPLRRDTTAIDGDAGAAIDGERRLVAEIDAIGLAPQPICAALAVIQTVVPQESRARKAETVTKMGAGRSRLEAARHDALGFRTRQNPGQRSQNAATPLSTAPPRFEDGSPNP